MDKIRLKLARPIIGPSTQQCLKLAKISQTRPSEAVAAKPERIKFAQRCVLLHMNSTLNF